MNHAPRFAGDTRRVNSNNYCSAARTKLGDFGSDTCYTVPVCRDRIQLWSKGGAQNFYRHSGVVQGSGLTGSSPLHQYIYRNRMARPKRLLIDQAYE